MLVRDLEQVKHDPRPGGRFPENAAEQTDVPDVRRCGNEAR
jgi:hypothetical protein